MRRCAKIFFKFAIVLNLGVFLFPYTVSAAEIVKRCSQNGYTIATINGVFTDKEGAGENKRALEDRLLPAYNNEPLTIDFLLNPSHLGGVGDILKSAYQGIFDKEMVNDYDLTEIIKAASEKVRTQKLLLVAHSQGNFYANSFYDSVAGKVGGVPTESIGIYGVATPASRVAGGGKWLTSDTDKVIAGIVDRVPFKSIMAPNTHIELSDGDDALGHNFTDIYLKYRTGQIVSDIESSLDNLKINNTQNDNESCIAPPKISIIHKTEKVMFAVADPVANVGVSAVSNTVSGTYYTGKMIASVVQKAAQKTTAIVGNAAENIKSLFSKTKIDQSVAVANIGQAANNLSVIPVSTRIQTRSIDSSSTTQNDTEELTRDDNVSATPVRQQADETPAVIQTQLEIVSPIAPLEARNDTPIHAPYQWPEEIIHAPHTEGDASANNSSLGDSGNDVSQPVFVFAGGEGPSQSLSVSGGSDSSAASLSQSDKEEATQNSAEDSSSTAQNDIRPESAIDETPSETEPSQSEPEQQIITDIIVSETTPLSSPQINFYLTNYNVRSQNFTLNWEDKNSVVQNWELQYKIAPNFGWEILKQVQDDSDIGSPSINSGHNYDFTAQYDDITYYFRLRGQDASGNYTDWKTLQADISTSPIVINEIAWRGTEASPYDEWIELANKTDQEIDINDWILKTTDGNINVKLTGKIAANGFYLLERATESEVGTIDEDSAIANIAADQIYKGMLTNRKYPNEPGQNLELLDKDNIKIDNVWTLYAGDNNTSRTSERINIWSNSLFKNNWQPYAGAGSDGEDANGNPVYGTPRAKNSQAGEYFALNSGVFESVPQITQDVIFLKNRGPYTANGPTEIRGVKAYVEPGTKFEFSNFGFIGFHDGGELLAKGTENEKIYIKSSNSAGVAIYFSNGAKGELDNVEIEGGMVRTNTAIIKISNSLFKNGSYGFLDLLNGSEFDISNSEFNGNNYGDAIVTKQSQGKIYSNNIKNNRGNGIYVDSLSGVLDISGNSFSGNSSPIATNGFIDFDLSGNIFDNGVYELLVYNPVINDGEVVIISNKISYILYDRAKDNDWYKIGDPEVKAGGILKIEPGAIVKFNNNSLLKLNGRLEASGTPENPIVFKHLWDYASHGDMTSSIIGEIDSSKYIQFGEESEYVFENVVTRESGDSGYRSYWLVKE